MSSEFIIKCTRGQSEIENILTVNLLAEGLMFTKILIMLGMMSGQKGSLAVLKSTSLLFI